MHRSSAGSWPARPPRTHDPCRSPHPSSDRTRSETARPSRSGPRRTRARPRLRRSRRARRTKPTTEPARRRSLQGVPRFVLPTTRLTRRDRLEQRQGARRPPRRPGWSPATRSAAIRFDSAPGAAHENLSSRDSRVADRSLRSRTLLAARDTGSPGRSLPGLGQAVAFQDERPDLAPVLHVGGFHRHAVLLPRVRLEPGVGCEEPAGVRRLELEHEATHAVLPTAAREEPPSDPEANLAEVLRLRGIREREAHLSHPSKRRLRGRHEVRPPGLEAVACDLLPGV